MSRAATLTSDTVCSSCPTRTYQNKTAHTDSSCPDWRNCTSGQLVSQAATSTSDTVCSSCPALSYQSKTQHLDSSCLAWRNCSVGHFVLVNGSLSADRQCGGCSGSTNFSTTVNQASCTAISNCSSGQFVSQAATSSSNTVCSSCPSLSYQAKTQHLDASCSYFRNCSLGEFVLLNGTASSDRQCGSCSGATNFSTSVNQASCAATRTCNAGQFSSQAPTPSSDRSCSACPAGSFQANTGFTGGACGNWTECRGGSFVSRTPSSSADRLCSPCAAGSFSQGTNLAECSPCAAGSFAEREGTINCQACKAGTDYQDQAGGASCKPVSAACDSGDLEVPPTVVSDRRCYSASKSTVATAQIAEVRHASSGGSGDSLVPMDYLASAGGLAGGAALPARLTLSSTSRHLLVDLRVPDIYKLRMAVLGGSEQAALVVELAYCEAGQRIADYQSPSRLAAALEPLQISGFALNERTQWQRQEAYFYEGGSCFSLLAWASVESSPRAWDMQRLLLVLAVPSEVGSAPRTYRLLRTSAVKMVYTAAGSSYTPNKLPLGLDSDPGPLLFLLDVEPPVFGDCPAAALQVAVAGGSSQSVYGWRVPVATENSGVEPVVSLALATYRGQLVAPEGISVVSGTATATLVLVEAPYTATYTAVDGSGNRGSCVFRLELVYEGSGEMVAQELQAAEQLVGGWSEGAVSAVFGQGLVCGNGSSAGCGGSKALVVESAIVEQERAAELCSGGGWAERRGPGAQCAAVPAGQHRHGGLPQYGQLLRRFLRP